MGVEAVVRGIYVIQTDTAGCFFYRLHTPLSHLNPTKFHVHWTPPPENPEPGSVVIGQRIAGHNDAWLGMCWDPGILAVYDIDDDLLNIDPGNAVPYSIYHDQVDGTRENIAAANVVTCSTQNLAEYLKQFNPNVVVLPNCLPRRWYAKNNPEHMVVGWAGSMFHGHDGWEAVRDQLAIFSRRHPDVTFRTVGADYMSPAVGVRSSGWSTMDQYWWNLDFSVGLAPLRDTPFNQRKSHVKVLEYGARGIVPVVPRIGQYTEFVESNYNGFVYDNPGVLASILETLYTEPDIRKQMSALAYDRALDFDIAEHIHKWEEVYAA